MSDHEWQQAVAAVLDSGGIVRGTAFFVGPDLAVTCAHVVRAAGVGSLSLRAFGSGADEPVIDTDLDSELDLALLRVKSRPGRPVLRLDPDLHTTGLEIISFGFPRDRLRSYPDGYPMKPARISGPTRVRWWDRLVDALVLVDADVGHGMSGAPAVDGASRGVIGVLRFAEQGTERALAIPSATAVHRWPKLLPVADQPVPSFADVSRTVPESMARSAWDEFRPNALHCVVVGSESLSTATAREQLAGLIRQVLSNRDAGTRVWEAFLGARQASSLVGGTRREFSETYSVRNVQLATFDVLEAFASPASLDLAVRLLVEADLALFDVTGFEPGVMLLLGVRAATRRGVTITSHGGGWEEGDWKEPEVDEAAANLGSRTRLDRPFNLSDLSLGSHTPPRNRYVGADLRINRLADRVRTGFEQLARQPFYRDLPVYDALRQLGVARDAWITIPLEQEVLVLCSYAADYFPTWRDVLKGKLQDALFVQGMSTDVYRLQDLATPQLISQSLYERIRRCAACVADWSGSSPSTFFELGVRMTVSPWGVVQIVSKEWLRLQHGPPAAPVVLEQVGLMARIFMPMIYETGGDEDIAGRIAAQLVQFREQRASSAGNRVRRAVVSSIGTVEERLPNLYDQLRAEADALSNEDVDQNIPQALFYEVDDIKADRERSARERRLAAWLYLEHRVGAGRLDASDPRRALWRDLGSAVASDLFETRIDVDVNLAVSISDRIDAGEQP